MMAAVYDVLVVYIKNGSFTNYTFIGNIETLKFEGFLKVYDLGDDNTEDNEENGNKLKNEITKESKLSLVELISQEKIKEPPSRYTEANIVRQLEKMEIGRPSTYASIIDKIQNRGYVEIKNIEGIKKNVKTFKYKTELKEETKEINYGKESTKFVPTDLGYEVLEFMETYFPYIVDYEFTANMEKKLDEIANGKMTKIQVMGTFYKQLMTEIAKVSGTKMDKIVINSDKLIGELKDIPYYLTKTKFGDAIKWDEDGETKYKSLKYLGVNISALNMDILTEYIKYPKDLGNDIKLFKDFKKGSLFLGSNSKYYTVENENIILSEAKKVIAGEVKPDGKTGEKFMKELDKDHKLWRSPRDGKYFIIHKKNFYPAPNEKVTLAEAKKIVAGGKKK